MSNTDFEDDVFMADEEDFLSDGNNSNDFGSSMDIYSREAGGYELLTKEEEEEYGRMLKGNRSERAIAKTKLVEHNLRLVLKLAQQYERETYSIEDAVQDGNVGLMKAAEMFDVDRGFRFATYAAWWIKAYMQRGVANTSKTIRLPVHVFDKLNKIIKFKSDHAISGESFTLEDVAEYAGLSPEDVKRLEMFEVYPLSIDMQASAEVPDVTIGDTIKDPGMTPEEALIHKEMRIATHELVDRLQGNEKTVIIMRYGLDGNKPQTLESIGNKLHLSRERIRQIEAQALLKLRNPKYLRDIFDYVGKDEQTLPKEKRTGKHYTKTHFAEKDTKTTMGIEESTKKT